MIAIIGVGSPFGADTIAKQVIDSLKRTKQLQPYDIEIAYYDRPGLHLLEVMKPYQTVHIVDAMMSDRSIGSLHRYTSLQALQCSDLKFSSHDIGLAESLALADALGELPEQLIIHGIEINEGSSDHAALKSSCDQLANNIIAEILSSIKTIYE